MKKYTLRKLGKKLLPVAFGIFVAGTASIASDAQANEIKNNDTTTKQDTQTTEAISQPVTKVDVDTAKANFDTASNLVEKQTTLVNTTKAKVDNLTETINKVELDKETFSKQETVVEDIKTTLANKEAEFSKEELDKTQTEYKNALVDLEKVQNDTTPINNPNKIVITPELVKAIEKERETIRTRGWISVTEFVNETLLKEAASKNKYISTDTDPTLYDINNLPLDVRKKLNLFFVDLTNQYLEQVNPEIIEFHKAQNSKRRVVLNFTVDLIDKIADTYVRDSYDLLDKKTYTFSIYDSSPQSNIHLQHGHTEGIREVFKSYNLPVGGPDAPAQPEETRYMVKNPNTQFTYSQLEEIVYNAVTDEIFNYIDINRYVIKEGNNTYKQYKGLHTITQDRLTLVENYMSPWYYKTEYSGIDFSSVNGTLALHLISLVDYHLKDKNFDKTEVTVTPNTSAIKTAQDKVTQLKSEIKKLELAQKEIERIKNELSKEDARLNELKKGLIPSEHLTVLIKELEAISSDYSKESNLLEELLLAQKNVNKTYQDLLGRYNLENKKDRIISTIETKPKTDTLPKTSARDTNKNTIETKPKTDTLQKASVRDVNKNTTETKSKTNILPKTSAVDMNNNTAAGVIALGLATAFVSRRKISK
ncbi:MAG: SEC10/PgrA surface exclusion domain-containing protein [Gemella sp.]|nr:SEC10/PgrA surface exclusion domain-containing protein [Gemella sp.]